MSVRVQLYKHCKTSLTCLDEVNGVGGRQRDPRSPVIMVYNLDAERFSCKRLFNLMSLYGNVNKINFIRETFPQMSLDDA